jgi:hypothetical protein
LIKSINSALLINNEFIEIEIVLIIVIANTSALLLLDILRVSTSSRSIDIEETTNNIMIYPLIDKCIPKVIRNITILITIVEYKINL